MQLLPCDLHHRLIKKCVSWLSQHRSYNEAAVFSGARGSDAMNAAWRKQAATAVQDDHVSFDY
jgi:hypothetical protein